MSGRLFLPLPRFQVRFRGQGVPQRAGADQSGGTAPPLPEHDDGKDWRRSGRQRVTLLASGARYMEHLLFSQVACAAFLLLLGVARFHYFVSASTQPADRTSPPVNWARL